MSSKTSIFFHPFAHRMHMVLMLMVGWAIISYMRINLGMTMTCMVNSTAIAVFAHKNGTAHQPFIKTQCDSVEWDNTSTTHIIPKNDYGGELVWTPQTQNIIFSSSFWGSLSSNLPAGYLSDRTSPRNLLLLSCAIMSISTLTVPFLAKTFGATGVLISRFFLGIGDGFVLPAANWILSRWIPNHEKSQASALFTAGFQIAGLVGVPVAAAFCASDLKWPGVFYLCGALGLLWTVIFYLTGKDSPKCSKFMSKAEKIYLEEVVQNHRSVDKKTHSVPWKRMMLSKPVWACLCSSFCFHVLLMFIASYMPTFLKEVMYLKMMNNGIYSALPHLGQITTKIGWSVFIDYIRKNNCLSSTASVRLSQVFSAVSTVIMLSLIYMYADCTNSTLIGVLFVFMGLGMGPATSGFYTSLITLAPPHTGILTSISMTVGAFGMIACPCIVNFYRVEGTPEEWRNILLVLISLVAFAGITFGLFASGETQEWAMTKSVEMETLSDKLVIPYIDVKETLKNNQEYIIE